MDEQKFSFDCLTELPFGLPGRVFRSPMPFRFNGDCGDLFQQYQEQQVKVVVMLVGDEECEACTGMNLRQFYQEAGLRVISMPITDFDVPEELCFARAVDQTLAAARAGLNLVIHCYAGIGRTGLFAACLAKQIFHFSGEEAIQWVRRYVPQAVETHEQAQWVNDF